MGTEDLERFETEVELAMYREYREVVDRYEYVVETERRYYLANGVDVETRTSGNGEVYFNVTLRDAWVWDMYRPTRSVGSVRIVTFKDVNVERIPAGSSGA